jgi:N-6 DNA Methylase
MTFVQPAVIKVAKAVARAESHTGMSEADSTVRLGVVAALLLLGHHEPEDRDPRRSVLAASDEQIAQMLEGAWCLFTITRPELAFRCGPFGGWLNEEPWNAGNVAAAAGAARAAVEAGLLAPPLDRSNAQKVDVLGHCNLVLRDHEAPRSFGRQFYTPAPLTEAMASMALAVPERERSICDSYAGTGGMLRAAAEQLRKAGEDPHDFWWYGCDIDPVVVAALAVNAHVWDLGPRVLIGCTNVLTEPDWKARAAEEQQAAVAVQETLAAGATLLAVAEAAERPDRSKR